MIMARIGVTYLDIANAAEAIKKQDQEPTVDRVRERLGTGSKSTIAPHLKRWKSKSLDSMNDTDLPSDLVEVIKSLYERVQESADSKIEKSKKLFDTEIEALKNELNEVKKINESLSSKNNTLEHTLKNAEDSNQSLMQSNSELQSSIEKVSFEHQQAQIRLDELKATRLELKQENKDIREHFEHYQHQIARDRQVEREQFQLTINQLQLQNKELSSGNSDKETLLNGLRQKENEDKEKIDSLREENQQFQLTEQEQHNDISLLKRKVKSQEADYKQQVEDNGKIKASLSTLSTQHTETEQSLKLLTQSLEQTKAELFEAKDKVIIQDNDYKILLQEKSIIQGQLSQLQKSL